MFIPKRALGRLRDAVEHLRSLHVESISVAYPDNERSLVAERGGYAEVRYQDQSMEVRRGHFNVDELFQQLMSAWKPLREGNTNAQTTGTVRVVFSNDTSGTFFIYDPVYLEDLFANAQDNLANSR